RIVKPSAVVHRSSSGAPSRSRRICASHSSAETGGKALKSSSSDTLLPLIDGDPVREVRGKAGECAISAHDVEDGDSVGHGNVQRLLGTELRDFHCEIGTAEQRIIDSLQFIPYAEAQRKRIPIDVDGGRRLVGYFEGCDRVAFPLQLVHEGYRIRHVLPAHRVLSTQSRLVQSTVLRCT